MLVLLEAHYLQQHDGAYSGDVAPSTLARAVSSLTCAFAMRHRVGPWCADPALGVLQGNPCESINIADFQTAYRNAAQEAGQYEVSATPMTLHDFETLMRLLDDDIDLEMSAIARSGGNVQHLVRLCRDAASFSTLWARGSAHEPKCRSPRSREWHVQNVARGSGERHFEPLPSNSR